jgi:hypothetical protein
MATHGEPSKIIPQMLTQCCLLNVKIYLEIIYFSSKLSRQRVLTPACLTAVVAVSVHSMDCLQHALSLERLQTDMMARQDTVKLTCPPGRARPARAGIGKVTTNYPPEHHFYLLLVPRVD